MVLLQMQQIIRAEFLAESAQLVVALHQDHRHRCYSKGPQLVATHHFERPWSQHQSASIAYVRQTLWRSYTLWKKYACTAGTGGLTRKKLGVNPVAVIFNVCNMICFETRDFQQTYGNKALSSNSLGSDWSKDYTLKGNHNESVLQGCLQIVQDGPKPTPLHIFWKLNFKFLASKLRGVGPALWCCTFICQDAWLVLRGRMVHAIKKSYKLDSGKACLIVYPFKPSQQF